MKQAKSSLLKLLMTSLRKSIISEEQKNNSGTENIGRPWSRREFIRDTSKTMAMIGVGGMLSLSACKNEASDSHDAAPPEGDNNKIKQNFSVAIIGAGIAGLNCAYQLQKNGIKATLYEASKRNGGRILTHYNDSLGLGIFPEFGGDFIDSNHSEMLYLAKEFNLELIDLEKEQQEKNLAKDIFYFDNRKISEKEIVKEFSKVSAKIAKDIESLGEDYDTPEAEKLDNTPLATYINGLKCAQWLKDLLHSAFVAEYGLDCSEQSSINMLCMINPNTSEGFKVFGESDERFRIKSGNSRIIETLVSKIGKDNIKNNFSLTRIEDAPENKYWLSFENGESITVDYVVMTIPFTILRSISMNLKALTKEKKQCIDELGYGNNTKLVLAYEGTPWSEKPNDAMGYLFHKQIVNGWDSSYDKTPNNPYGAYVCYFGGKYSATLNKMSAKSAMAPPSHLWKTELPEAKVKEFVQELGKVFTGSKEKFAGKHVFVNWIDYPYVKASYSCYKVGQWTTIAGMEGEAVGNVFFAGEHCSEDFQGFMNGAAESGKSAANQILAVAKKTKIGADS